MMPFSPLSQKNSSRREKRPYFLQNNARINKVQIRFRALYFLGS